MKSFIMFLAAVILLLELHTQEADALNPCSAKKMWDNYNEMTRIGCKNCDKYFHCQGNYEAVHKCSGPLRISTATAISDSREFAQGGNSGTGKKDSDADQAANRYGRGGGDCAARYLKANNCAYNPRTKQCKW